MVSQWTMDDVDMYRETRGENVEVTIEINVYEMTRETNLMQQIVIYESTVRSTCAPEEGHNGDRNMLS